LTPVPEPSVRTFANLEELSLAAAREFTRAASSRLAGANLFSVALSGGTTPRRFFELLATPEFSKSIQWSRVHLFQVDERCVPPDSPQSNYKMIRETLLDRIELPNPNFHRMQAERPDREAAAREYENDLRRTLDAPAPEWPRFDMIFLGLGDDGHTASLFPGTSALAEDRVAVCPNYVEKLKMWRMTLTMPVLNAGAHVIFLVAGSEKKDLVRQLLRGPTATPPLPSGLVKPARGAVDWYLDQAAASSLL
jgi:6-phosphogluconolactonase